MYIRLALADDLFGNIEAMEQIRQCTPNFVRDFYDALVGLCLNRFTTLVTTLRAKIPLRHGIAHSDIIKSYLGLLCLGKSDFEAVENVRRDRFFKESLGIGHVSSAATSAQRAIVPNDAA